jgi:hypothetical protein
MIGEAFAIAVFVVVGTITTAALYAGFALMVGGLYVVRCSGCDHFRFSLTAQPHSCAYCRHPMLLHPIRGVRHRGSAVRARGL